MSAVDKPFPKINMFFHAYKHTSHILYRANEGYGVLNLVIGGEDRVTPKVARNGATQLLGSIGAVV